LIGQNKNINKKYFFVWPINFTEKMWYIDCVMKIECRLIEGLMVDSSPTQKSEANTAAQPQAGLQNAGETLAPKHAKARVDVLALSTGRYL
jgi:hypothetical protein